MTDAEKLLEVRLYAEKLRRSAEHGERLIGEDLLQIIGADPIGGYR